MALSDPTREVVTVAPTSTVVVSLDVRSEDWLSIQIDNLDAAQTFSGIVERRLSSQGDWSPTTIGDFAGIAAEDSVTADLDISATGYLRIVGTMSGAGGDVAVFVRRGQRK
jgi:hypothetical protein